MNFLELTNKLMRRVGLAGGHQVLSAVEGQTGKLQEAIDYVSDAELEIQMEWDDWTFHNRAVDVLVSGDYIDEGSAGFPTDLARVIPTSVYGRLEQSRGKLSPCAWAGFREKMATQGIVTAPGLPTQYSVDPSGRFYFDHISSDSWIVHFEYYTKRPRLISSNQVSVIPEEFHDAIIHKAAVNYGIYEEAQMIIQAHEGKYQTLLKSLESSCLPGQSRTNVAQGEEQQVIRNA